jgi:hypothetical protein
LAGGEVEPISALRSGVQSLRSRASCGCILLGLRKPNRKLRCISQSTASS